MASQIVRRLARNRASGLFSSAKPTFLDRSFSSSGGSESNLIRATLFPGDGIGPEIADAVRKVCEYVHFDFYLRFFVDRKCEFAVLEPCLWTFDDLFFVDCRLVF